MDEPETEETNEIMLMRLKTEQTADLPYPVECENVCSFLLLIQNRVTPLTTSPRHDFVHSRHPKGKVWVVEPNSSLLKRGFVNSVSFNPL